MLSYQSVCLFQQYFCAGEFIMAGGAEEGRPYSGREAKPLKKSVCFLRGGFLQFRCVGEAAADKNTDPDLQGQALRSFNVRVIRDGDSGGFFGFLADARIGLFGIPATFSPGKSDSGYCFPLKQARFKLLRLPNWGKKNYEPFVDISLERYYNTGDEPECANIPALRLETRFASAERQTVRRVIYD